MMKMKVVTILMTFSSLLFLIGECHDYPATYEITKGAGWLDEDGQISNYGYEENVDSVKDCENLCSSNTWFYCVGFTYVSSEKRCDLKKDENAVSLKTDYPSSIISGEVNCRKNRVKYDWYLKERYSYGSGWLNDEDEISTFKELRKISPRECERACENTRGRGCKGFTYVASATRCDLKTREDAVYLSKNYDCNVISFKRNFVAKLSDHEEYLKYLSGFRRT